MSITREHIKAARTVLGLGVRELAERAGVSPNTVSRFENGSDMRVGTLEKLRRALEAEGIEFLISGEPGIRWRRPG